MLTKLTKGDRNMDGFFREIFLIIIKSVVSFAFAGAYALLRIAIFGDAGRVSATESLIVLIVSITIGCWIVNTFTKK